ncbi:UDPglucose 6-dehydrogenase [Candidatus Pelagibacter sp. HTCC7211]|uniref:UDP-glucose dehydrogenase family protein n=2 Tax=Pseudomonadota TaxID=1224 RepID=UPI000183AFE9|nr:UDP-glucose/GDP-mannose dehydrogenase family protein [Candidatus Pelagibacter sp. HTCC7211]EDZ59898.1 UDPglucose 6-dehydrogenase [Candidatus Pelagibacter sp. HTCC7211]MBD1150949.1 UDP-glucose/GDP-mannose dehydrogenase family protein [Pelagibacterales bacterium SAG-MED25]
MKLCMIGTGYVGLVSGVCFSDLGNIVYCVDKDKKKIDLLNNGIVPIYEPGLEEILKKNYMQKRLIFTSDLKKAVKNSDIIFICVGTPTKKNSNSADLKYVFKVANELKKVISKYKIIITKSTVPVTTGDKIEKILIRLKNKKLVDVVSNPEFLREGEAIRDFSYPDRVIIGTESKKANRILKSLYSPIIKKNSRYFNTSRRGAELIKYASNAFLATKISFINELANLTEKAGVDIKDISSGMGSDQRIGERFLRAGPAYGGSCFPKDTRALIDTAKKFKTDLSIVNSVVTSNEKRKVLLTKKLEKILKNKLKNKVITFLGVTFKPNTDDMREASSIPMIKYLNKKDAKIKYYDPSGEKNEFKKLKNVRYCKDIFSACLKSDLIVLHTEWNDFKFLDFKKIVKQDNFKIFDMRNIYSPAKMKNQKINYFSIGR